MGAFLCTDGQVLVFIQAKALVTYHFDIKALVCSIVHPEIRVYRPLLRGFHMYG